MVAMPVKLCLVAPNEEDDSDGVSVLPTWLFLLAPTFNLHNGTETHSIFVKL